MSTKEEERKAGRYSKVIINKLLALKVIIECNEAKFALYYNATALYSRSKATVLKAQ
jgi:hypothetical protein